MKNTRVQDVLNSIEALDELIASKNEKGDDTTDLVSRRNELNTELELARSQFEAELNNVSTFVLPVNFLGYIYNPKPRYSNWAKTALNRLENSLVDLKNARAELDGNNYSTKNIDERIKRMELNIEALNNEVKRFNYIQDWVNELTPKDRRGRKKGSKNAKKIVVNKVETTAETPSNAI